MHRLLAHRIALVWILIITASVQAQTNSTGKITGLVYDDQKKPISQVAIQVIPLYHGTMTDANGYYAIENLPPGIYKLKIKHIGFKTRTIDPIEVLSQKVTNIDAIQLEAQIIEMNGIVVTATRTENRIFEVSNAINLVSTATIQKRNAKTSAEALREEPGIFIQKTNHGGGSATIRGLSSNQILILVDGVRLNNSTYRLGNHQYLTTVDNQALQQIEVVRGPTSVLYGSDALGGTIHLISKKPEITDARLAVRYNLLGRYASADDEQTLHGDISIRSHGLALITGFSIKNYGDLRRGKNSAYPQLEQSAHGVSQIPTGFKANDFDARMVYGLTPAQTLIFAYQRSRQKNVPRYDKYENNNYYRWLYHPQNRDLAYLTYENDLQASILTRMQISLSFQQQVEGREMQKSISSPLSREKDNVRTQGLTMEFQSAHRHHQITFGGEAYLDRVASERFTINTPSSQTVREASARYPDGARYNSFGIFLQDEIRWHRRWILIPGARWSFYHTTFRLPEDLDTAGLLGRVKQNFQSLTGSSGLIFKLNDQLFLNANLAQGFRAPNLSDISKLGESKGNIYEVPNPDLRPEKMMSLDLGIKINSDRLKAAFSAYYSQIRDLLASADATFNRSPFIEINGVLYKVKSKKNIGRAEIHGLESTVDYFLFDDFSLHADLTWTYGQNTTLSEPVGGIPPVFGRGHLRWLQGIYYCEFYLRFAGKQNRLSTDDKDDPRIPIGGTPGWHTFNLRAGLQIKNWGELQMAMENLLDVNYREHGSGVNGPGRNFILSLALRK